MVDGIAGIKGGGGLPVRGRVTSGESMSAVSRIYLHPESVIQERAVSP